MPRLTAAIATQQHKPRMIGCPPVLINLTRLVFSPMAAMAIMMKNLDNSFKGENAAGLTPRETQIVVMMEAKTKKRMKNGKTFFK